MHFMVKLAVPGIRVEAFFLRNVFARAVHGGEVLRENDAPLEFERFRIVRAGEIDEAALAPIAAPVLRHLRHSRVIGNRLVSWRFGEIFHARA